jgi:hypothetical protein
MKAWQPLLAFEEHCQRILYPICLCLLNWNPLNTSTGLPYIEVEIRISITKKGNEGINEEVKKISNLAFYGTFGVYVCLV